MLNRRHFLAGAAGAALVAPLLPGLPLGGKAASAVPDAHPGTPRGEPVLVPGRGTFSAVIGEPFQVHGEDGQPLGELLLARVEDQANSCARVEQFVLGFDRIAGAPLPSGIYTLRHRNAGVIGVRLEPLARADEASGYQAAFALLRERA